MKRLFVLVILCACDHTDNVGEQCRDVQVTCTSTASCANYPGSICGPNGLCTICDSDPPDAPAPDAATCTPPSNPVACGPNGSSCANYPGTVCNAAGFCDCPTTPPACTPPPPQLPCTGTASCGNYPGSICGPNGTCVCP